MFKGGADDVIHPFDRQNVHGCLYIVGNFLQVARIVFRDNDPADTAPVRRQQLLLQATDPEHLTAQRNLAGHGNVRPDRYSRQHRYEGRAHPYSSAGTILWRRAFGHMYVYVVVLVKVSLDAEIVHSAAHERQRRLYRLLHDIAQGTGFRLPSLTTYGDGLDVQQFATHLRPSQTGNHADAVLIVGPAVVELAHAVVVLDVFPADRLLDLFVAKCLVLDDLAADLGDFALQRPHAGFARCNNG